MRLTWACNQAIAAKFGHEEHPAPLRWSQPTQGKAVDAWRTAGVPLEFAEAAIGRIVADADSWPTWRDRPQSLHWFTQPVLALWEQEQARTLTGGSARAAPLTLTSARSYGRRNAGEATYANALAALEHLP